MTISQERYRKDNSGADQKLPPAEETAPDPPLPPLIDFFEIIQTN